ncbi:MAG: AEC family transporter, partial [Lachnospiraceae bacterium]|nr:AEC family transporter [Lachnospiraceae bacterium]
SMATIDIKKLFTDIRLLLFSVLKLVIVPVAGLFLLKLFIRDQMLLGVCMVMLATPVASMTAMLSQQYDGDYELASRGVALTTILSVATMPLVSIITGI